MANQPHKVDNEGTKVIKGNLKETRYQVKSRSSNGILHRGEAELLAICNTPDTEKRL